MLSTPHEATDNVIDVGGLSKSFGRNVAVDHVSLQVKRGEIFGFLGPNGSGKTTTIRMLCGLMKPDAGTGVCLGHDIIRESQAIKPLVGYVPQTFSLYKDLTVQENLYFIARVYDEVNLNRVKQMINDLDLMRYSHTLAGQLSGGWKQRLSLAAALVHQPKLLLLDEPTAGVDPKTRREFWLYISYLTTQGITVLVSTHYMDEAERCNRLGYIFNGRLIASGTVSDIVLNAHLTTWAASGGSLNELAEKIKSWPGVEQVVPWGNELRICGSDAMQLKSAIDAFPAYAWHQVTPSLEEVFIHLVQQHTVVKE